MANSEETTGEMSDGLQVELFHPESDREPGDTNIQALGFDIHPVVFPVALVIIALFILVTVFYRTIAAALEWTMAVKPKTADEKGWEVVGQAGDQVLVYQTANDAYDVIFTFIGTNFGWFYLLAVNVFIVVLLYFALGKYSNTAIKMLTASR